MKGPRKLRWRTTEQVAVDRNCVICLHAGDGNEYGKWIPGMYMPGWEWFVTDRVTGCDRKGHGNTKGQAIKQAGEAVAMFVEWRLLPPAPKAGRRKGKRK